jgi:hypothetical protein
MPQANSLNHPLAGRLLRAAATRMKHAVSRFSLATLGAVALYRAPAVAQEQPRAQQIQVYDGEWEAYAQPVSITHGNGATANLGIATKYYVTTNLFWDLGIRYRSVDRVVSLEDTLLTTAGAGTA